MTGLIVSMIFVVIVVFAVLVFFMQKIFKSEVSSATVHLDNLSSEYARKEEEIRKQLEDVKRQSAEIMSNAQKEIQQQKEISQKEAQDEKSRIVAAAHLQAEEVIRQADNARLALLGELEQKINERAIVKSIELLQIALPEDFRREIHAKWVDELIASGFNALDRLRIPEGTTQIKIVAAFGLDDRQRRALAAKLEEKLGYAVTLEEQQDPAVIAGIVVSVGSLFFDGSLKFKLQEAARVQ